MQAANSQSGMSIQIDRWLNSRAAVYWGVALFSGLLSLYRIATRDLINGDGILYIDVARAFLIEGIGGAIDVYHWPLYGILIGLAHKLTGLGFENSAGLVNIVLMMIVCVMLVRVYEVIGGKHARIWVAGILVLALPILNDYRDFVIRGYGFWAFMLISLYAFIQYSRSPDLKNALKWQLGIAVATLFRIEGFAFIALAPFYFLFIAGERRKILSHVVRLNGLFIALVLAAVAYLLASGAIVSLSSMEIPYQLSYASPMALIGAVTAEAGVMFSRNRFMSSVEDAQLILASGLFMLVFVKVLTNAGLPFIAVWAYGVHRKWLQLTKESYIVIYFSVIAFLSLVPVAGNYFFLSSRTTVVTVLFVSLISFQYVDQLLSELSRRRLRKWRIAVGILILVLFLDGLISTGASKGNIRLAGEWIKTEIPPGAKISCNEARLEFYSEDRCIWTHFGNTEPVDFMMKLKLEGYTHFLLWVGRKDVSLRSAVDADTELVFVKEFLNRKGSSVRFYSLDRVIN